MSLCDMCGSKDAAFVADVEGSMLNVCEVCGKYGKIKSRITFQRQKQSKKEVKANISSGSEKEIIQIIIPDYSKLIRDKREQLGLKQEDFAKNINEKVSLIHKIEIGEFEPSMELARKLERFLNIKLVETHEEIKRPLEKTRIDTFTIGDFIKVKR